MSSLAQTVTPASQSTETPVSIVDVANRYQELIKKAAEAGQLDLVQALIQEMNHAIAAWSTQQLMTGLAPQTPQTPPPVERFYDTSTCSVDLERLVYDGDRDAVKALLLDPEIAGVLEGIQKSAPSEFNLRTDLLKKALHVTPRLAPQLHQILENCRTRLGMKREVEVFIDPSNELNAFVVTPEREGKVLVVLSSALVQAFSEGELSFVIGHELGHHLFEHRRLPVHKILEQHGDGLTPIQRMRLFAWKRSAEVSADRVGILCAQSYDAALSALFKLSSGLSTHLTGFDLSEYSKQLAELQSEITSGEADPTDWYSTHPFNPVRIRAAEFFWKSQTFRELSGAPEGSELSSVDYTEPALEQAVGELLKLMEPAALSSSEEAGPVLGTFFFWAALDLALADESVDPKELQALAGMVSPVPSPEMIAEFQALTTQERWTRVVDWGQQAALHLSPRLRMNLIRDLAVLASADGKIEDLEMQTLRAHCRGLGISDDFLVSVLSELKKDLD